MSAPFSSKRTMIEVKQEHIDDGVKHAERCPIALAINEVCLDFRAAVCHQYVSLQNRQNEREFVYNHNGEDFVYKFDRGDEVWPFTLIVEEREEELT